MKSCPTSSSKLRPNALALSGSRDGVGGFMSGSSFIITIINGSLAVVSQECKTHHTSLSYHITAHLKLAVFTHELVKWNVKARA